MCSYCGCESVEVIGRFMREHTEIVNASGALHAACRDGDPQALHAAADRVRALFGPHSVAEEAGIFTVLAEDPDFTEHVHQLCREHVRLEELLDGVVTAPDPAAREAAWAAYEHLLRHHIAREDNSLFPAAAIAFAGPEWERVTALTPDA